MIKKLFHRLHNIQYKLLALKSWYYKFLFDSCGSGFKLWGNCYIKNPQKIVLGKNVSINDGAYLNGLGGIVIGDNVSISAQSILVSTSLEPANLSKKTHVNKKINIGSNVQIGAGAIILAGIKIGDNVMVGAGSVVTKDIEGNVVVAGNPARVLRSLKKG